MEGEIIMNDEMNYGYGTPEEAEKPAQEPNYGEPLQYNYGEQTQYNYEQKQDNYSEPLQYNYGQQNNYDGPQDNGSQSYGTIPPYQDPYRNGTPEEPSGFAIASLVLGIISLLISCLGINIVTGILAIIFGAIHLVKYRSRRGMAVTGLILGIVSIVIFIALVVIGVGLMVNNPTFYNEILNEL